MATKKKAAKKSAAPKKKVETETGFMLKNADGRFFGIAHEHKNLDLEFSDAAEIHRGLEFHNEIEHGHVFPTKAEAEKVSKEFEQYELEICEVEIEENDLAKQQIFELETE